jgi:hypothetical protein
MKGVLVTKRGILMKIKYYILGLQNFINLQQHDSIKLKNVIVSVFKSKN